MSNTNQSNNQLKTVKLVGGSPWGFRLKGGKEFGEPLKIDTITAGGKASNSILCPGQYVVEINGVNVLEHRHDDAKNLIISAGSVLILIISDLMVHSPPKNLSVVETDESSNKSASNISNQTSNQNSIEKINNNVSILNLNNTPNLDKIPDRSSSKAFISNKSFDNSSLYSPSSSSFQTNNSSKNDSSMENTPTQFNKSPESTLDKTSVRQSETGLSGAPKNPSKYFQKIQMSLDVDSFHEPPNEKLHTTPVNVTPSVSPDNSPKKVASPTNFNSSKPLNSYTSPTKPTDLNNFKHSSTFNVLSSDSNLSQISDKTCFENRSKVIAINGKEKCHFCDEFIKGHGLLIIEKYYHMDHVVCYKCHIDLKPMNFFEDGGKLICEKCCTTESPKCRACGQTLITNYLKASDGCYHEKCFNCTTCHKSLVNKGFLCSESKIFCSECYENSFCPKCDKCFKPIKGGDTYVESQNKSFHSECFTCKVCSKSLASGKYFLKNGDPVCHLHA